jgi:hypothetical protein
MGGTSTGLPCCDDHNLSRNHGHHSCGPAAGHSQVPAAGVEHLDSPTPATGAKNPAKKKMGRLRFELRTNRLKAECSTAELATRARWAPSERITQGRPPPRGRGRRENGETWCHSG